MKTKVEEEARRFDTDGSIRRRVNEALEKLRTFKAKYPFTEDPSSIENLKPQDILEDNGSDGYFFLYIQYRLEDLGHLTIYTNEVYFCIKSQLATFKELLYTSVDKENSLAEKVDAPWNEIKGLGGDRHIAKKIIFCFNYDTGSVVPIFSTSHLEHFLSTILEEPRFPLKYESLSLGEKYEFLTNRIFEAKASSPITKHWEITYFCWFLYTAYPPPEKASILQAQQKHSKARVVLEQQKQLQDFMALLNNLRRKDKITAEELRTYRDRWQQSPQDRETLTIKLSSL